jgi:DNA-binding NarL/FixJ family response regulator
MSMNRVKVLVVEDDNFTRSTLVAAIRTQGIEVVGSASNARDALAIQARYSPDIAMLDFDLGPGPTGIDVAHALRSRQPNIGILILSTFRDPRLLSTKLPPLPNGSLYLCKQDINDVRKIVDQLLMVNEKRFGQVVRKIFPKREGTSLTEMQMDILSLVAKGLTTAEIARQRNVGEKAIENTISRISIQLGIVKDSTHNQRVQLTRAYMRLAGKST